MSQLTEFSLIDKFFKQPNQNISAKHNNILQGIGDDCAIFKVANNEVTLTSCDSLIVNKHFFADVNPFNLGHKVLAVNLSDLAACGAKPIGFTLAATIPHINETWLQQFSAGLLTLAKQYNCPLIGGDTTKGELSFTVSIFGSCPIDKTIMRHNAQLNDDIYISGCIGDARAGLEFLTGKLSLKPHLQQYFQQRLELPNPRIELAIALRDLVNSAIDISDGLTGDLTHLLQASKLGAHIELDLLTASASKELQQLPITLQQQFQLTGGDDYELIFTASPKNAFKLQQIAQQLAIPIHKIGKINNSNKLSITQNGIPYQPNTNSFDHFG